MTPHPCLTTTEEITAPEVAVLLGTALGDALGLPAEGLSAAAVARRFGNIRSYRLWGETGYVSDDTELSALLLQALVSQPDDPDACAAEFRRLLVRWFWRLPWGVGLATVRASLRATLGVQRCGVDSAGNGAAMRSAPLGVFFRHDPARRRSFGRALAEVTHTDPRAVEGALFVAEVAALLASSPAAHPERLEAALDLTEGVNHGDLRQALQQASKAAQAGDPLPIAPSGYVLCSVPWAFYCLQRHCGDPLETLAHCIGAGGDTDSNAAILGAWLGALHGEEGLPHELLSRIHPGPFGPRHLRSLGLAAARARLGEPAVPPPFSAAAALGRNLALYPVILGHGFSRVLTARNPTSQPGEDAPAGISVAGKG